MIKLIKFALDFRVLSLALLININMPIFSPVTAQGPPSYYNQNLASPNFYWGRVLDNYTLQWDQNQGGLVSAGPWYIDTNHRESALLIGPAFIYTNSPTGIPGPVDLTGTRIRINLTLQYINWLGEYDARQGGQLVFWFQSNLPAAGSYGYVQNPPLPCRTVNYAFSRNILPEAQSGTVVELVLTDSINDWICLSRNQDDVRATIGSAAKYTCALNQTEFRQAMQSPINMGVLFLLPRYSTTGAELGWLNAYAESQGLHTQTMGFSKFVLKEFTIVK